MTAVIGAVILTCVSLSQASVPLQSALENARIDQNLGIIVPADLPFTDDHGSDIRLGQYFNTKPTILILAYFDCPNLCPMLLRHLTQGLNGIALETGKDFDVIVISFNPNDTLESARRLKLSLTRGYRYSDRTGGWHFLIGAPPQIERLKNAVGFHCIPDPQSKTFAHALGAFVLSPNGTICHVFHGVDFAPADLNDALRDASQKKLTRVDNPEQQLCLDYRADSSRYGRLVLRGLQILSCGCAILLVGYIAHALVRERQQSETGVRS